MKKIKGDDDPNSYRSPCTILKYPGRQNGNLYAYQAIWVMQKGPVRDAEKEISHMCCTEGGRWPNPCINVEHMRLESKRVNLGRAADQTYLKTRKSHEGPLFRRGGVITKNQFKRYASFTNCGVIKNNFVGFYVHKETKLLERQLSDLERSGVAVERINIYE